MLSKLFAKDLEANKTPLVLSRFYTMPSNFLLMLLGFGMIFTLLNDAFCTTEILFTFGVLGVIPLLFYFSVFKGAQRVKEYHCGEKDTVEIAMPYFSLDKKWIRLFYMFVVLGFGVAFVGVLL